ncbi:siderophore-interacting protein [Pseudokineococcus basanitobsidens]|uniref:Siderophore-interacting protein n=1 Tax=Pseudokineococcus basanitobsidens TaxID=1926649 RepID=A0ABU8RLN8_9ACTN
MTTTTERPARTDAPAVRRRTTKERLSASAVPARVARRRQVTPSVVRVTLVGEDLRSMSVLGDDQYFRLLLPRPGQARLRLPVTERWWPEITAMPEDERPVLRNYTVRAARPDVGELDVDVVAHGGTGPGSRWALTAEPGDEVGVIVQDTCFTPPPGTTHVLLVADATAVPAVAGVLASLPDGVTATVLAEVPTHEDAPDLPRRDGADVRWRAQEPGRSLLEDLRSTALPAGGVYAWVAGEAATATGVRRHLVRERGLRKEDVYFCGYWRADAPAYAD